MAEVKIYTTQICPFCVAAKNLFQGKGVPYEEIDVSTDHETRIWLSKVSGQRTVPQIFIGERSVGGFSDVAELERRGELDSLLAG